MAPFQRSAALLCLLLLFLFLFLLNSGTLEALQCYTCHYTAGNNGSCQLKECPSEYAQHSRCMSVFYNNASYGIKKMCARDPCLTQGIGPNFTMASYQFACCATDGCNTDTVAPQ